MKVIDGEPALWAASGEEVGVSAWHRLDQDAVSGFAALTGDEYWIHVDPERAAGSPLGGTIAHGLLTLALGPRCCYELLEVRGLGERLNYGYDRVRFTAPVPVGSRVRMRLTIGEVATVKAGLRVGLEQTFEIEGSESPACFAAAIWLWRG